MMNRKEFAEKFIVFRRKPFSLKGYEYLIPLYQDRVRGRRIVLKTGRQVAKSVTLCNLSLIDCFQFPNFTSLYITFTQKQMLVFARQKIDPLLAESKKIAEYYLTGPYIRDTITDKRFSNGSSLILRHAYISADSIRGISADRAVVDEAQLMLTDNVPIIEECVSHSTYKWITYCGTPASEDSSLEDLWDNSTQNEWMLVCPHCNFDNYQDMGIISEAGLVCKNCGKVMDRDKLKGRWVSFHPECPVSGYRFTQLVVPWLTHEEIMYKLRTYPTIQFYNEVLALPHSVSELAINKEELFRNFSKRENTFEYARKFRNCNLVAGVDWGYINSFTALAVGYHENGVTRIVYVKKFVGAEADPLRQLDMITEICANLGVKFVLADFGMGVTNNPLLAQKLAHHGIHVHPILYSSQREMFSWEENSQRYQANRTMSLGRLFSDLKIYNKVELPNLREFPDLYKDILNVRIQKRLLSGSDIMFYDHRKDEPDDVAHAINYCHLAAPLITPYF